MILPLPLLLVLQVQIGPPPRGQTVVRDSTAIDSTNRRAPKRLPVTAELARTAFKDETTRDLFNRARRTRLAQDSSIRSYDAKVYERLSVGMAVGQNGRDRLMYRHESALGVRWALGVGAWIDLTGARVALPIAPPEEEVNALRGNLTDSDMTPIPYFPGYESLWIGGNVARSDANDVEVVNPLAVGAEAYYTFALGDSLNFTLPDGFTVKLREMEVRPRSPKWNLAVGSLWFDVRTAQLVRAAYRLSVPLDVWVAASEDAQASGEDGPPMVAKALISPLEAQITAIAIEYGLHEGRFWLPRLRSMEGFAHAAFLRVPLTIEHAYRYNSVNAELNLAPIIVSRAAQPLIRPDSLRGEAARLWRDSVARARRAFTDSLRIAECEKSGKRTVTSLRFRVRLPVALQYPCDIQKLINSPDLPKSVYDSNEEIFNTADRDRLVAEALSLAAQAPIPFGAWPRPKLQYGLGMTRYNRIEGFSTGLLVEQQLGGGYVATAVGRFGFADREPNVELGLARTNLSKTIKVNGYNRLVSAGDWGHPLTFGASVSAFLFGRDEGFYYRASGAELAWTSDRGIHLDWRAFAERQRTAVQKATHTASGVFGPNIVAAEGQYTGAAARYTKTIGLDPRRFRAFTDLRLEAATGDSTFGRGALEVTVSRGLPKQVIAALTVAGGTTLGEVPSQRRWYLGGTHTVRGLSPDTSINGTAFWLTRAELGRDRGGYRGTVFGDLGWTGPRDSFSKVGRPLSGAGVGWSFLDGLLRFDVARGIYPTKNWRVDFYLESKF